MENSTEAFIAVERLTKCTVEQQKFLLRLVARSPVSWILLWVQRHRKILYMLKSHQEQYGVEVISYSAMILAAKSMRADDEKLAKLDFKDMTLEEIRDLATRKIGIFVDAKKRKRKAPQREFLLRHWGEVKEVKARGSFEDVMDYLRVNYKREVARSTIWRMWQEFEGNNDRGNENE